MLPDNNIGDAGVKKFVDTLLSEFINPILGILMTAAVCYFIYTVIQFFAGYKNGADMSKLKAKLVWGTVGVIIVASCWTFVQIMYGFRYK